MNAPLLQPETATSPAPFDTLLPDHVGMQGGIGSWHHQGILDIFGIAIDDPRAQDIQQRLVAHQTHEELVESLLSGKTDIALIAVDNNNSGRVATAIEALRDRRGLQILGKIALSIEQCLLTYPEHETNDIKQVASQRPALDQAQGIISAHSWIELDRPDTAGSALEVAENEGMLEGPDGTKRPTAAIASALAGRLASLTVGEVVSPPGNATTFWLITSDAEKYESVYDSAPDHAAFTFSVPNDAGALHEIIGKFSDAGFDFTDIDCHLGSERPGRERSFFAEVKFGGTADKATFEDIVAELQENYALRVLGEYRDNTDPAVHATAIHGKANATGVATHELFRGRSGASYEEGSRVVYVQATNQVASLKGMLNVFKDQALNLEDMSRPYMPDTNGSRGFYFVLQPGADATGAVGKLVEAGYNVEQYTYRNEALEENAA